MGCHLSALWACIIEQKFAFAHDHTPHDVQQFTQLPAQAH
jgi:hypothetical protein